MDGMLQEMPSSLFVEWQAYDRIDPMGDDRSDLHAAIVAAAAENGARAVVMALTGQRLRAVSPEKYMPQWERRFRDPMDPKTIYRAFKMALTLGRHLPNGT